MSAKYSSRACPRRVIVVGAGVLGLMCARELTRAGARVTIVDRGRAGGESSWAGGGILSPLLPWRCAEALRPLVRWSQARYPALMRELAATGPDPQWTRSGLLILDPDAAGAGVGNFVAGARLRALAPWLAPQFSGPAVWLPEVAQVRNPRLTAALVAALRAGGAELREACAVRGFQTSGGRLAAVVTDQGVLETDCCVVAAGAWSGELLSGTGVELPITPVRGQMLLLHAGAPPVDRIVLQAGRYLIPRRDGRVLVGSTLESVGFDKSVTGRARTLLRDAARTLVPALGEARVEKHWAGLRPGTAQGIPFIDRHPGIEALYVCAGHHRNGLTLAPASARLLADLVLERTGVFDPAPFRISIGARAAIA